MRNACFGGPHNEDYNIFASILRCSHAGKLPSFVKLNSRLQRSVHLTRMARNSASNAPTSVCVCVCVFTTDTVKCLRFQTSGFKWALLNMHTLPAL